MLKSIFNLIQIVPQNKFDCFEKKYLNNWTLLFFQQLNHKKYMYLDKDCM